MNPQQTPSTFHNERIAPPSGPNLSIESMREIATRNGAISFVEQTLTDDTDYGYLLNKEDAALQFGAATYTTSQYGFSVTHSIASFIPKSLLAVSQAINTQNVPSQQKINAAYVDVIDITVPYILPHLLISPKVSSPFSAFIGGYVRQSKPVNATSVRLEGDFSDFVTTLAVKGQDVTAFTYLAPDVMDILLPLSKTITVEWIGNHIYIYYRQDTVAVLSQEFNTPITGEMHEKLLRAGLLIADKLGKNARPGRALEWPIAKIARPNTGISILFSLLFPIFITFCIIPALALGAFVAAGVLVGILLLISLRSIVAAIRAAHLLKKYTQRYGQLNQNI